MKSTLDRIDNWLERAEEARYNVRELAENCKVSRGYLRRYFRERYGRSPKAWLNEIRLLHSLLLLIEGEDSVKRIGLELHFSDPSAFHKRFKSYFGCSPLKFRESCNQVLPLLVLHPDTLNDGFNGPSSALVNLKRKCLEELDGEISAAPEDRRSAKVRFGHYFERF